MIRVQLGDVATWLTGIATVGALILAFNQIESERAIRREAQKQTIEDRTREQAAKVTAWIEGEHENAGHVAVSNSSNGSVYRIIVSVVGLSKKSVKPNAVPLDRYFLDMLPPGIRFLSRENVSFASSNFEVPLTVEIAFIDSAGRNWIRRANGKLQQLTKTPAKYYGVAEPIVWTMPPADLTKRHSIL